MKKIIITIIAIASASCANVGPWKTETEWGVVSQDENGQIVIVPHPRPIVIPAK